MQSSSGSPSATKQVLWKALGHNGKVFPQAFKWNRIIAWGSGEHKAASGGLSSQEAMDWDEELKDLESMESSLFYFTYFMTSFWK